MFWDAFERLVHNGFHDILHYRVKYFQWLIYCKSFKSFNLTLHFSYINLRRPNIYNRYRLFTYEYWALVEWRKSAISIYISYPVIYIFHKKLFFYLFHSIFSLILNYAFIRHLPYCWCKMNIHHKKLYAYPKTFFVKAVFLFTVCVLV